MKKWVIITLISLAVVLLIVGILGFYFYNKYSEEINAFKSLKKEADALFSQGVTGPDDCSSLTGCGSYCNSNKDECIQFCVDNPENGLCNLAVGLIEVDDFNQENL